MKLDSQGYDILQEELSKNEGPFSKTHNVMLALDLMAKEEELSSTQVTKFHLANIIKILCNKLGWIEESEDKKESENDTTKATKEETEHSDVSNVTKNSEKVCKFYRGGNCKHGKSGKKPDQNGDTCRFSHPQTCKKFELFGYKEKGCKLKNCEKLHLSLCKKYMRYKSCAYGEKCKFFHPKGLKDTNHIKENQNQFEHNGNEERSTYANVVKKSLQPQISQSNGNFLGVSQPVHQNFAGQGYHIQQPFLGQANHTSQALIEMQKQQKLMLDLFMNLNQKMTSMYNPQM